MRVRHSSKTCCFTNSLLNSVQTWRTIINIYFLSVVVIKKTPAVKIGNSTAYVASCIIIWATKSTSLVRNVGNKLVHKATYNTSNTNVRLSPTAPYVVMYGRCMPCTIWSHRNFFWDWKLILDLGNRSWQKQSHRKVHSVAFLELSIVDVQKFNF